LTVALGRNHEQDTAAFQPITVIAHHEVHTCPGVNCQAVWPQNLPNNLLRLAGPGLGFDQQILADQVGAVGERLTGITKLIDDLGYCAALIGRTLAIGGQADRRKQC
jgi:hypothetical protein